MKARMFARRTFAGMVSALVLFVLLGCSSEKTKMYESKFDKDKQELQERIQGSIADVDQLVGRLKTEAAAETPEMKAQVDQKIQQLDSLKTVLNEKLTRLGETSQGQWDQFKSDASKTIDDAERLVKGVPAALGDSSTTPDTTSSH